MLGQIVKPWPGSHGKCVISSAKQKAARSNGIAPGSLVEVEGPYAPDDSWTCGTEVVWWVVDSRVPDRRVYCCKHQITFEISGVGGEETVSVPRAVSA